MKNKDKLLIVLASYFYAVLGLFFTGSFWWFLILPFSISLILFGGKKHV